MKRMVSLATLSLALLVSSTTIHAASDTNPIRFHPDEMMPEVDEKQLIERSGWTSFIGVPTGEDVTAIDRNSQELNHKVDRLLQIGAVKRVRRMLVEVIPVEGGMPMAVSLKDMFFLVERGQIRMEVALRRLQLLAGLWEVAPDKRDVIEQLAAQEREAYLYSAKTFAPYVEYYLSLKKELQTNGSRDAEGDKWKKSAEEFLKYVGIRERRMRDTMARADRQFFNELRDHGLAGSAPMPRLSAAAIYDQALLEPVFAPENDNSILSVKSVRERSKDTAVNHYFSIHEQRYQIKRGVGRIAALAPLEAGVYYLSKQEGPLGKALAKSKLVQAFTSAQRDADLTYEYGYELTELEKNINSLDELGQLEEILQIRLKGTPTDQRNLVIFEYLARRVDLRDNLWNRVVRAVNDLDPQGKYGYLKEPVNKWNAWISSADFKGISPFYKPSPVRTLKDWALLAMPIVAAFHASQIGDALHTPAGQVAAVTAVAGVGYKPVKSVLDRRAQRRKARTEAAAQGSAPAAPAHEAKIAP